MRYVPDLLIADAVLPQLDGPQVATRLAENPDTTDMSVVLVGTAAAEPTTPEQRAPQDRRLWERFIRDGRFEGSYRIRRRTVETVTIRCAASANVSPGLHVSALAPARLLEVIRS